MPLPRPAGLLGLAASLQAGVCQAQSDTPRAGAQMNTSKSKYSEVYNRPFDTQQRESDRPQQDYQRKADSDRRYEEDQRKWPQQKQPEAYDKAQALVTPEERARPAEQRRPWQESEARKRVDCAPWFNETKAAAEPGDVSCQTRLGGLYEPGWGTEQNLVESYVWYARAAKTGKTSAVEGRDRILSQLSPEPRAKATARLAAAAPPDAPAASAN